MPASNHSSEDKSLDSNRLSTPAGSNRTTIRNPSQSTLQIPDRDSLDHLVPEDDEKSGESQPWWEVDSYRPRYDDESTLLEVRLTLDIWFRSRNPTRKRSPENSTSKNSSSGDIRPPVRRSSRDSEDINDRKEDSRSKELSAENSRSKSPSCNEIHTPGRKRRHPSRDSNDNNDSKEDSQPKESSRDNSRSKSSLSDDSDPPREMKKQDRHQDSKKNIDLKEDNQSRENSNSSSPKRSTRGRAITRKRPASRQSTKNNASSNTTSRTLRSNNLRPSREDRIASVRQKELGFMSQDTSEDDDSDSESGTFHGGKGLVQKHSVPKEKTKENKEAEEK